MRIDTVDIVRNSLKLFLAATLLSGVANAAYVSSSRSGPSLTAAAAQTCALTGQPATRISCWGKERRDEAAEGSRGLVVGPYGQTCAITAKGIVCPGKTYPVDGALMAQGWGGNLCWVDKVGNIGCVYPIDTSLLGVRPTSFAHNGTNMCVVTNHKVLCGGKGAEGLAAVPRDLRGKPTKVVMGGDFACALTTEEVRCWLKQPPATDPYSIAYSILRVPQNLDHPFDIAAANNSACVLDRRGPRCWGPALRGHVEDGVPELDGVVTIVGSAGTGELTFGENDRFCGLTPDGEVRCMGRDNRYGQSNPTSTESLKFTSLSAGYGRICALTDQGMPACWASMNAIWQVPPGGPTAFGPLNAIYPSFGQTCAMTSAGLRCWGPYHTVPTNLGSFDELAIGGRLGCVIQQGSLKCWGYDHRWLDGLPEHPRNPRSLTVGMDHGCAMTDDGVKCWGYKPGWGMDPPADLGHVDALSAGNTHTCAMGSGTVRCWGGFPGNHDDNQFEDANPFDSISDVQLMKAGGYSTCVVQNDRKLSCSTWKDPYESNAHWNVALVPFKDQAVQSIQDLAVADNLACVLGQAGQTRCVDLSEGEATPLEFRPVVSRVAKANQPTWSIAEHVQPLLGKVYQEKKAFLRQMLSLQAGLESSDGQDIWSDATAVFALDAFFESVNSDLINQLTGPEIQSNRAILATFGFASVADVPVTDRAARIAIGTTHAALVSVRSQLPLALQKEVEVMTGTLGGMLAHNELDVQDARRVAELLDAHTAVVTFLNADDRLRPFGATLSEMKSWCAQANERQVGESK